MTVSSKKLLFKPTVVRHFRSRFAVRFSSVEFSQSKLPVTVIIIQFWILDFQLNYTSVLIYFPSIKSLSGSNFLSLFFWSVLISSSSLLPVSVCLSVCLSDLSVNKEFVRFEHSFPSFPAWFNFFIFSSACLCLSVCLSVCLSACLSYLSVCQSVCLPVCLICLSVCLSVCLFESKNSLKRQYAVT